MAVVAACGVLDAGTRAARPLERALFIRLSMRSRVIAFPHACVSETRSHAPRCVDCAHAFPRDCVPALHWCLLVCRLHAFPRPALCGLHACVSALHVLTYTDEEIR